MTTFIQKSILNIESNYKGEKLSDNHNVKSDETITKRSLNAIKKIGRNTTMFLRKEDIDYSSMEIRLDEITHKNFLSFCNLKVAPHQHEFVAENVLSMAEANFSNSAWMKGIVADNIPVGFIMLSKNVTSQKYVLWRFMIDEHWQGKGIGAKAFELLMQEVSAFQGAHELRASYVPGKGAPKEFFVKMKFVHTGQKIGEEICLVYYIK